MAKSLISRTILNSISKQCKPTKDVGNVLRKHLHTNELQVKEIRIPVQWGHISAKLWGNENEQPILALHGWQDNAGTFDPLAQMLAHHRPILAIDFQGHGHSSWYPPGMHYYAWEFPRMILYLKNYFKWDKLALLGHSMGSIASLRFACTFPDDVEYYIAIDSLVQDDYDLNLVIDKYPKTIRKLDIAQTRLDKEPPSYTLDEIANVWHRGAYKSISLESVKYLIQRGTKQSSLDPNKYYFSRDPRLKYILFNPEDKVFVETLVMRLKCPTLYFKGTDSQFASDAFSVEMRELMEKNNPMFESHFLPGTHHLHLNTPEKLAPIIKQFLEKYNNVK